MSDPTNPPPGNPYGEQPPSQPGNPGNPYGQPQQPAYGQQQPPEYGQQQPPAYGQPQQPAYGQPQQPAYGQPPTYGAPAYPAGDPDKRPGTVTAASIITIIFSALGLIAFAGMAFAVQGSDEIADDISRELEGQSGLEDYSTQDILNLVTGVFVVFAIWCLIALVMAVLAMRRQNWARVITVISAVMSALLCLFAITSVVTALPLMAAIATIILFFTGGANEWYSRKNSYASQLPPGTQQQQPWG